jgi:hypothetical protein
VAIGYGHQHTPNFSPRHRFTDWPNIAIPGVAADVYAIWEADEAA